MEEDPYRNVDAGCYVIATERSTGVIYRVLDKFIPNHDKLTTDYTYPTNNPAHIFNSEEEILSYYCQHLDEDTLLFWNTDEIMVGAEFTSDGMLVLSLDIDANGKDEYELLDQLKMLLHSNCGVVNHGSRLEFKNGSDFKNKYCPELIVRAKIPRIIKN